MSNIHRFGDDDNLRNRRFNLRPNDGNNQQLDPNLKIPFISQGQNEQVDPRQETFWQMLKINLCPSFKINSLTFTIILLNTLVFCFECMKSQGFGRSFLEIPQESLIQMGANIPVEVKGRGGYYRLLIAMFLHANFLHLLFNQISIFVVCSAIEYTYGFISTSLIYLITGVGSNLFAAHYANNYEIFVGCSGAITGLLACVLSFFIINWNKLEVLGPFREYLLCIFIMVLLMAFLFPGSSSISTFSHVGGFLVGLFAGLAIPKPLQEGSYEKYARIFGWVLLILFFSLILLMFNVTN